MYINGDIVGMVEYTLFESELTVSNIIVRPELRRRGYGSKMMSYLKKHHSDYTYKPSIKTDLGAKFKHKEISDSQQFELAPKVLNAGQIKHYGQVFKLNPKLNKKAIQILNSIEKNGGKASERQMVVLKNAKIGKGGTEGYHSKN
jgi:GNAT superfamily N-acetyltransferase